MGHLILIAAYLELGHYYFWYGLILLDIWDFLEKLCIMCWVFMRLVRSLNSSVDMDLVLMAMGWRIDSLIAITLDCPLQEAPILFQRSAFGTAGQMKGHTSLCLVHLTLSNPCQFQSRKAVGVGYGKLTLIIQEVLKYLHFQGVVMDCYWCDVLPESVKVWLHCG